MYKHPPRNLGLDLVRVTEASALAAGRWMGLGRQDQADQAAAREAIQIVVADFQTESEISIPGVTLNVVAQ